MASKSLQIALQVHGIKTTKTDSEHAKKQHHIKGFRMLVELGGRDATTKNQIRRDWA